MFEKYRNKQYRIDNEYCKNFTDDFVNCIKSRCPFINIDRKESFRFRDFLQDISCVNGFQAFTWDAWSGLFDLSNYCAPVEIDNKDTSNLTGFLKYISNEIDGYVEHREKVNEKYALGIKSIIYVIENAYLYYKDPVFISWVNSIKNKSSIISVVLTSSKEVCMPSELYYYSVQLIYPEPNKKEILRIMDQIVDVVRCKFPASFMLEWEETRSSFYEAAKEATIFQIQTAMSRMFVQKLKFDIEFFKNYMENLKKIDKLRESVNEKY